MIPDIGIEKQILGKHMTEFLNSIAPYIYGFMAGWIWYPLWQALKKIYSEAKKAQKEW
jgi:hypothetical protein